MAEKKGPVVAVCLAALVIFCVIFCVLLYRAGSFPAFNSFVDRGLNLFSGSNQVAEEPDPAEIKMPEVPAVYIAGKVPVLSPVTDTAVPESGTACVNADSALADNSIVPAGTVSADSGSENPAAVSVEHDITYDGYTVSSREPAWVYPGDYPVMTPPGVFTDSVVYLDAASVFICLDRATGQLQDAFPCSVYPGTRAYVDGESYIFEARAGGWYRISFADGNLDVPARLVLPEPEPVELKYFDDAVSARILPSDDVLAIVQDKMNSILSVEPAAEVPGSILYNPSGMPAAFEQTELSPVFVFSPDEQGIYTLGLCSQDGSWIRDNAFVVLFTRSGESRAVSLDYVSDRPQITIHLSDTDLYYACAGFFPGMEIPAEPVTAYFQIKPAP